MAEHHGDRTDHTLERLIREVLVGQNRLERKIDHMSGQLDTDITALTQAVTDVSNAISAAVTEIKTLLANPGGPTPAQLSQIEAQTSTLETAAQTLVAAIPPAPSPTVSGGA